MKPWVDGVFMVIGFVTLILLFIPAEFKTIRYIGYGGMAVFLAFLLIREILRRRRKKEKTKEE